MAKGEMGFGTHKNQVLVLPFTTYSSLGLSLSFFIWVKWALEAPSPSAVMRIE